jgi:ribosomal protein S18 acetylase RimI-like enzyme
VIRPLCSDDIDEFRNLRGEALANNPGEFGTGGAEWWAAPVEKIGALVASLPGPDGALLGAFDGPLVGMAGLQREAKLHVRHKASVWGLYVVPGFRRRGLGRALVEELIAHAQAIGVEVLRAVSTSGNAPALGLFMSLGFEQFGLEPRSRKVDGGYLDQVYLRLEL